MRETPKIDADICALIKLKAKKIKSYFNPPFANEVSGVKLPKLIYIIENDVNKDRNKGNILDKKLLNPSFVSEKTLDTIDAKINQTIIKANSILNKIDKEQNKKVIKKNIFLYSLALTVLIE